MVHEVVASFLTFKWLFSALLLSCYMILWRGEWKIEGTIFIPFSPLQGNCKTGDGQSILSKYFCLPTPIFPRWLLGLKSLFLLLSVKNISYNATAAWSQTRLYMKIWQWKQAVSQISCAVHSFKELLKDLRIRMTHNLKNKGEVSDPTLYVGFHSPLSHLFTLPLRGTHKHTISIVIRREQKPASWTFDRPPLCGCWASHGLVSHNFCR